MENHTITIKKSEIDFDIQHKAYKRADALQLTEKERSRYDVRTSDQDWVIRQVDTAIGKIRNVIGKLNSGVTSVTDDLTAVPASWTVSFYTPDNWAGDETSIKSSIHDCIVCFAVSDWLRQFDTNEASLYEKDAYSDLESIRTELYTVKAPTK